MKLAEPRAGRCLPAMANHLAIAAAPTSRTGGRKRIAILSTWHPEPVDNGRKQRTRQFIEALADTYDIVLISLLPPEEAQNLPLSPVPSVNRQHAFPLPVYHPRTWGGIRGSLSLFPRSLVATWNRDTAEAVSRAIAESGADVVIGTDLRTLRYLRFLRESNPTIRTVLDEPDVSPFVTAPPAQSIVARVQHRLRYLKYSWLLRQSTNDIDAVVVASAQEADAFSRLSGSPGALIIGNGVSRFPPPWQPATSRQLLYTGSLSYAPNAEAVAYYAASIHPIIAEQMDAVTLAVTGVIPSSAQSAGFGASVRLTGRLDDLVAIYQESRAFVAPILSGTGTRIKLLEALAHGIPVVTTSKGIEGIPVTSGIHVLIADDPREFARATLAVLMDDHLARRLGSNGRSFVMQHGNWESSAVQLRQLTDRLLHARA